MFLSKYVIFYILLIFLIYFHPGTKLSKFKTCFSHLWRMCSCGHKSSNSLFTLQWPWETGEYYSFEFKRYLRAAITSSTRTWCHPLPLNLDDTLLLYYSFECRKQHFPQAHRCHNRVKAAFWVLQANTSNQLEVGTHHLLQPLESPGTKRNNGRHPPHQKVKIIFRRQNWLIFQVLEKMRNKRKTFDLPAGQNWLISFQHFLKVHACSWINWF